MKEDSSATASASIPLSSGLGWGLLGVAAFSFTVPLTRVAVGGLSPLFIGAARAVVAAVLAGLALAITRQRRPHRSQIIRLVVIGAGVVVGFPLLTSYALRTAAASHGAVVIAVLPAATAAAAVVRTRERPPRSFWLAVLAGAVVAIGFASAQGGGFGDVRWADALLFGAVLAAAIGYAEGGLLARELGSWQTVSWALVIYAPLMAALALVSAGQQAPHATGGQWLAFAYLGVVSMFLGFVAWYRGLAIGLMTTVSQIQLVQPVMSICWAALLLDECINAITFIGGVAVIACAALAVRLRRRTQ